LISKGCVVVYITWVNTEGTDRQALTEKDMGS